jgi:hypothetical protein
VVYFLQILQPQLSWHYVILFLSLYSGRCSSLCVKLEHLQDATRATSITDLRWFASQQAQHCPDCASHQPHTVTIQHASLSMLLTSSWSRMTGTSLGVLPHSKSLLNTTFKKVTILFCQMLPGIRRPLLFGRFPSFARLSF